MDAGEPRSAHDPERTMRAPPLALDGAGVNPLVRAANPLLDLALPLRRMAAYPDVERLRLRLVQAIKTFEAQARAARVEHALIAAARYALCTMLDETIASTTWGGNAWASRGLLATFDNEAFGGEKFFVILQQLSQDPRANLPALELIYVCLALGFEGRYRAMDDGRGQLDALRERLLQLIVQQRGGTGPELAPHWRGAESGGAALWRTMPVSVVVATGAALLLALHLALAYRLGGMSDPVFARLLALRAAPAAPSIFAPAAPSIFAPAAPSILAPAAPSILAPAAAPIFAPAAPPILAPAAPAVVAPALPAGLAAFLAPQAAQGLVTVAQDAGRVVITLRGDGVFASGSGEVAPAFVPLLGRIGAALATVPGKVAVIGHTDNVRPALSARFPTNYELSRARAQAVRNLLAQRAGPADRYTVEGRAGTEPLAPNDSAAHRARNRRVDIVLVPGAGRAS